VRHISDLAQISYVRQKEQLGLGHAVLMAKEIVGNEPFAVLLSDDVIVSETPCIGQLMKAYERVRSSVVAVLEVDPDETGRYGVIDPAETVGPEAPRRLLKVRNVVEKPRPEDAPSNLGIIGRYILTPKIFDKLEQTPRGANGEIQLTDAIERLMAEQDVYAYAFEGVRYDAGTTMGWLQASVELALQRADVGPQFRQYLSELDLGRP
jgi:UTP--glucose-1-phosphate uridylyltransferase